MAYKDARTLAPKGPAVFETLTLNATQKLIQPTFLFFFPYFDKLALLSDYKKIWTREFLEFINFDSFISNYFVKPVYGTELTCKITDAP